MIAGLAGVLLVWFNGRISPGTIGVDRLIDILVIAVIGGTAPSGRAVHRRDLLRAAREFRHRPRRAERFNTLIGVMFLSIVLFSPDGLLGLWEKARRSLSMKGNDRSCQSNLQREEARWPSSTAADREE